MLSVADKKEKKQPRKIMSKQDKEDPDYHLGDDIFVYGKVSVEIAFG